MNGHSMWWLEFVYRCFDPKANASNILQSSIESRAVLKTVWPVASGFLFHTMKKVEIAVLATD